MIQGMHLLKVPPKCRRFMIVTGSLPHEHGNISENRGIKLLVNIGRSRI